MTDDPVRLRNTAGADEVNARGVSYRVNKWGCVTVPAEDVAPLLRVGGFHRASPNDPSAIHSSIEECYEAAWHLPLGPTRDAVLSFLNRQPLEK